MAAILIGMTGPEWGTTDETSFIVDNIREVYGQQKAELANGQGDIVAAAYHGKTDQITLDFSVKTTGAPTGSIRGASFTLTDTDFDGTYYVDEVTNSKAKGEWKTGSLTATAYPESGFTSTTTSTT
ncbi:MAG: hypothetical protein HQ582_18210 [Planctomycetes bacterium]|nr:hypothetical protein [Planctomycetota bacterium]